MGPHNFGVSGSGDHSHDVQFPEDSWNLYAMLDPSSAVLNSTQPVQAMGVFKPNALKETEEPAAVSDADAEILFVLRFTSPVHVRKIMVIGGGDMTQHPSILKCYVNQENVDFANIGALNPAQEFRLEVNSRGTIELITAIRPFTNITSLVLYFPENHGSVEQTRIKYIGMQGDHTHYRREAVDTVYEVLCTGQDIIQPESQSGHDHTHSHGHGHDHSHSHDHHFH